MIKRNYVIITILKKGGFTPELSRNTNPLYEAHYHSFIIIPSMIISYRLVGTVFIVKFETLKPFFFPT